MSKIKIVAAILDTEKLTLYRDDAQTVSLNQGDPRIQRIIDAVTEPLSTQGWAEVSLSFNPEEEQANVYRDFENLVEGVVKFFRVHKESLDVLFTKVKEEIADNGSYGQDRHLTPVSLGTIPGSVTEPNSETNTEAPTAADVVDATPNQKKSMKEATADIMAAAKPVTDHDFHASDTTEAETMIAAVADEAGEMTIVPGMENLQAQFKNAAKLGSATGVTNFLKRISAIIGQRNHTIDELLRFMSRGDLPIADDGSIVAYKVLQSTTPKGYYVDCHSKQVKQRIGSFVQQDKVDNSRRTECSTGLHIARRGYLGGFPGDIIVLVKIAPEDVIAVPLNEPNKMRARGYHILSEIPVEEHSKLRSNNPIEGSLAKKLLNMAITGDHISIIEHVIIGGPKGTEVRSVAQPKEEVTMPKAPKPTKKTQKAEALETVEEITEKTKAPKVDVKKTSEKAVQVKTETRPEKAARLLKVVNTKKAAHNDRRDAAIELKDLKKAAKAPWNKLGLDEADVLEVERLSNSQPKDIPIKTEPKKEKPKAKTFEDMTKTEKAAYYLNRIEKGKTALDRRQAYQDLLALKKASKVSWSQLNVINFEAIQAKFEK